MLRSLSPLPFLEREAEEDAKTLGRRSARAPIVPSSEARSLAAAALRFGLLEMDSFTKRVMAEELNSESQAVEIFPCFPFAAALHELGV